MKKKSGAGHTGKIHKGDMHLKSHGTDEPVHETHHKMNKEHGTPGGLAPAEGYQQGDEDEAHECNEEHC